MNRFYYILATYYLLLITCCNGQNSFYKTISNNYLIWGYSIIQCSDGGYAMTGGKSYNTNNHQNVFILKTDANGDTLWTRTYGGAVLEEGDNIIQTTEGGYLISGITFSFGATAPDSSQAYLIKTDANGDTLWTKTYGGLGNEYILTSLQKNDGSYICMGYTSSFGAGGYDIYLLNLDANGDTLATRCYGGVGDDIANNFIPTPDKGYLLCGSSSSFSAGSGYNDVYVIKIDSLFNLQWSKTYGGTNEDDGLNVLKMSSGYYIISGFTSSFGGSNDTTKGYAICINNLGDTLWNRVYANGYNNFFVDIIETADSNLLFTGVNHAVLNQLTLTKINPTGDTLGCKFYNVNQVILSIQTSKTSDGGAIIVGQPDTTGFILKLDPTYNTNCLGTPAILRVNSPPTVVTNVATQQRNTQTITRGTHTKIGYGCTITTVCNNTGIEQYASTNNTQITLYPNPNGGSFTIEPNSNTKQTMQVYDVNGKLVLSQTVKGKTSIDASSLNSGVYFIHITDENGVTIKNDKLVLMGQ